MTPLPKDLQQLHGFFMIMSFVLGTAVGSFANVCISRWPAGLSIVKPRSRCPKCMNEIPWYDNIPLISWVLLRAKCRNCDLPISIIYPTVELITGLLFLAVYWRFGYCPATPVYMALCAAMVIITFQDLADWTIPDEITMPGLPIGIVLALAGMYWGHTSGLRVHSVYDAVLGALIGGGIILTLDEIVERLVHKPGMGMGDVKLLAMLGAFLGRKGALGTLMMASVIGSIVGVLVLLYFQSRSEKQDALEESAGNKDGEEEDRVSFLDSCRATIHHILQIRHIGFAPCLAVAGLVCLFLGPEKMSAIVGCLAGIALLIYYRVRGKKAESGLSQPDAENAGGEETQDEDEEITLEGHYLPFGPYLAVGGLIYLFYGPEFINWYIGWLAPASSVVVIR